MLSAVLSARSLLCRGLTIVSSTHTLQFIIYSTCFPRSPRDPSGPTSCTGFSHKSFLLATSSLACKTARLPRRSAIRPPVALYSVFGLKMPDLHGHGTNGSDFATGTAITEPNNGSGMFSAVAENVGLATQSGQVSHFSMSILITAILIPHVATSATYRPWSVSCCETRRSPLRRIQA